MPTVDSRQRRDGDPGGCRMRKQRRDWNLRRLRRWSWSRSWAWPAIR